MWAGAMDDSELKIFFYTLLAECRSCRTIKIEKGCYLTKVPVTV